jgi:predicted TIM-barrel fold metal-dependent hydrolase
MAIDSLAFDEIARSDFLAEVEFSRMGVASSKRRVIDADSHMDPPYEMWAEYLPKHLRHLAPTIEEGDEHDWVVFDGKRRPLKMISNNAGRSWGTYKIDGKIADMRKAWQPSQRLADMDADGIDAAVLYGGFPLSTEDPELYFASYDAYNRWLSEFCAAAPKRLIPIGMLPMRDVDETVRMMEDLAKRGFRTVNLPAFPQSADGFSTPVQVKGVAQGAGAALVGNPFGEKSYRDPEFERLWAAAEDLDMTIANHLGGRIPRFGDKDHFFPDIVMTKVAMAEPVAIAIFGGVFERHPKLRLVIAESGVGWLAWMAEYMDRNWEKQRHWTESSLPHPPSHYMEQNVFATFIDDRIGVLLRNAPGGRNIMWSSDYPHGECNFMRSYAVIERDFAGVPESEVNEIVCERARRVYGID